MRVEAVRHFTLIFPLSLLSPSLWETARHRLKYCLKRAVKPKLVGWLFYFKPKTTNQPTQRAVKPGGGRVVRWSWVNFQCRGVLLVWIRVGQGPTALAVGAGGGCLDIFTLIYHFSSLSPSLWETTRYRLKYCLKGSLSPKTTNQPTVKPKTTHQPTNLGRLRPPRRLTRAPCTYFRQ